MPSNHRSAHLSLLLAVALLFGADHLFLPLGLWSGALYLTSGTARFMSDRRLLPLLLGVWLALAALASLGRRSALNWLGVRMGRVAALAAVVTVEASVRSSLYVGALEEVEGIDRLWLFVLLPLLQALWINLFSVRTNSLLYPALADGSTLFVERYLLCDARLSFLPIGYIVTGASWVYPFRVGCRSLMTLVAATWPWRSKP